MVDATERHQVIVRPTGMHRSGHSSVIVVMLLALVATASCGPESGTDVQPGGAGQLDGEWRYVEGTVGGDSLPMSADAPVTLTINGAEVGGTSACNSYFGVLTVAGDVVTFSGLGGTEMACAPDVMALETAYLGALATVRNAVLGGGGLTLTGPDVELAFEKTTAPPATALTDTDWALETLVTGSDPDASASSPSGAPVSLVLAEDGSMSGRVDCNTMAGTWAEVGGRVETDLAITTLNCPGAHQRDVRHVQHVLGGPFTTSIDGDRLTLTLDDGAGLVFRAESTAQDGAPDS